MVSILFAQAWLTENLEQILNLCPPDYNRLMPKIVFFRYTLKLMGLPK